MTSGIPPTEQDFELLSAYLDGELAATARAELESRLAAEPALRATFGEMQRTVAVLKAAPRVTPPRNFTLDPAKYRRAAPWWARYRAIQFVGALGTLASIIIIAVGLLSFNVASSSLKNSAAPASAAQGGIVAALATATQNPNTLDKAQSAPLVPALINATTTPAASTTPAQAADEAALANDSTSGFASTVVPTSFPPFSDTASECDEHVRACDVRRWRSKRSVRPNPIAVAAVLTCRRNRPAGAFSHSDWYRVDAISFRVIKEL